MSRNISLHWFTLACIALVLLILWGGLQFYWDEYRQSSAREQCASKTIKILEDIDWSGRTTPSEEDAIDRYQLLYTHCLRSKGIHSS